MREPAQFWKRNAIFNFEYSTWVSIKMNEKNLSGSQTSLLSLVRKWWVSSQFSQLKRSRCSMGRGKLLTLSLNLEPLNGVTMTSQVNHLPSSLSFEKTIYNFKLYTYQNKRSWHM
jgi:hypothetical protein